VPVEEPSTALIADILIPRAKAYFFLSAVIRSGSIQTSFTGKLLNLLGVDMC
jgi:hypothetical protein